MTAARPAYVDHLVVLARDLASGADWCERTLGVVPAPGGEHPLMGTHNRLLAIGSPAHPRAYLEIIAVNPQATPTHAPHQRRWFDLDDPALHARVAAQGPQLIHWVAAVPDVQASTAALAAQGIDRGAVITASRPTPEGLLQWQITVRDDGQRLLDGCLPTLIQWGAVHPCDRLPASGVALQSLTLAHPDAPVLASACAAIRLGDIAIRRAPQAALTALLHTPRGLVELSGNPVSNAPIAPSP